VIRAYPRTASVRPGEAVTLHVSTDRPRFRIELYRQGATLEHVSDLGPFDGVDVPTGPPDQDWGWPAYTFDAPANWRSGAYVAMCVEIDADGSEHPPDRATTFGTSAKALFVVRSAQPGANARILYKISTNTFHAYNGTGYGSLYAEAVWSRQRHQVGFKVTMRRPGGGAGGDVEPGDPLDAHAPESRRQTFAHWDAAFVAWLEQAGYVLDYCTDLDLHQDPGLLGPYALLLSTGHDEYWTEGMRDHVDAFVADGGNVAYFSGNISHWRIHLVDNDTAIVCAKVKPGTWEPDGAWRRDDWHALGDPENKTTGVSSLEGGGWWNGPRDPLGYTVQHADHWVYEHTGLNEADVFGERAEHPLLGYEVDGADFRRRHGVAVATGSDGTPREFAILGIAELTTRWSARMADAAATMGVLTGPGGGIIFQGATTDWPALAPVDEQVGQITRNVLDRLMLQSVRVLGPLPARAGRMLATVGDTSSFHVDLAPLGAGDHACVWHVGGAELVESNGPLARVRFPARPGLVTVSVVVEHDGEPVAFGTHTLLPLTKTESLQLEATILVRELAMPGDPSGPWVMATTDPVMHISDVIPVRLPWVRERAARLQETAEQLIDRLGPDGSRFPDDEEEAQK
jgi:hypothetical protein